MRSIFLSTTVFTLNNGDDQYRENEKDEAKAKGCPRKENSEEECALHVTRYNGDVDGILVEAIVAKYAPCPLVE